MAIGVSLLLLYMRNLGRVRLKTDLAIKRVMSLLE